MQEPIRERTGFEHPQRFVMAWVAVSVVAETIAVSVAFFVSAATWWPVFFVALLEGLLLGCGQRWVLRRVRLGLANGWVVATVAGALVGRSIEFVADTGQYAANVSAWSIVAQVGLGAILGALVGGIMALPQAVVLRNRVDRHLWWWIAARALAWSVALPSLMLAGTWLASVSNAGPAVLLGVILLAFGAIAAFVAVIEGIVLERLLRRSALAVHGTAAMQSPAYS